MKHLIKIFDHLSYKTLELTETYKSTESVKEVLYNTFVLSSFDIFLDIIILEL